MALARAPSSSKLFRSVELDGTESGAVAHTGERDLVTQAHPFLCGLGVRYGLGSRPQLLETPLHDANAEPVPDALRALLLPPVETLEDARLGSPLPGVVLVDQELAVSQLPSRCEGAASSLRRAQ